MGKGKKEVTERFNFELTGELAEWLQEMKRRGFFSSNPEAVRLSLTMLRYYYSQIDVIVEQAEKNGKNKSP